MESVWIFRSYCVTKNRCNFKTSLIGGCYDNPDDGRSPAAGMEADSPECQSGMEACGGGALSHRARETPKTLSRHRFDAGTMSGQPPA